MKVGLVTIGQSPRDDVVPSMFPRTDSGDILQAGALDDMSADLIAGLKPGAGEHPLVTRLGSGDEVVVSKERITPHLQLAVSRLEMMGAAAICVLCTGEFNLHADSARLIYPDRLLKGVVDALLPEGSLGVVMPHAGQADWMRAKWATDARPVHLEVYSPYDPGANLLSVADSLVKAGTHLIVLDCMGYNVSMQERLLDRTGVPVVLANRLAGAIMTSMVILD